MQFMADLSLPCSACLGRQFLPEVLEVTYRDRNIWEVMQMSIEEAVEFFRGETTVIERLKVLREIGLGYLPLGQSLSTLSSGESMRLKLASILGGTGSKEQREIVFLDEPTTGLHVADIERLILCFEAMLEKGHTIVVMEHNEQLISAADYRIELGPGAGPSGGEIVWQGWQCSVSS
jgi:excinuclease ABC subunit A